MLLLHQRIVRDKRPKMVFLENVKGLLLSDAFRIRGTDGNSATLKGLGGGMGAKTGLYAVGKPLKFLKKK